MFNCVIVYEQPGAFRQLGQWIAQCYIKITASSRPSWLLVLTPMEPIEVQLNEKIKFIGEDIRSRYLD